MGQVIIVKDLEPPIVEKEDYLALFLAGSLGLIPSKGKKEVAPEILKILAEAARRREGPARINKIFVEVKNGGLKAEDILRCLEGAGIKISQSQFYTTYLRRFVESGLVVKKKHSVYALRAPTLEEALDELERDIMRLMLKLKKYARRMDEQVRQKIRSSRSS